MKQIKIFAKKSACSKATCAKATPVSEEAGYSFVANLKSKKGVTIELALAALVIVFGLCSIMAVVGFATLQTDNQSAANLQRDAAISQVGEDFISAKDKANFTFTDADKGWSTEDVTVSGTGDDAIYTMQLIETDSDDSTRNVILTVTVNAGGTVTEWRYS